MTLALGYHSYSLKNGPKITNFARVCYCYFEYNLWITLDVKSEERFSHLIFKIKCLTIGI